MVFSSLNFLYFFLPLTLAAYFVVPQKGKNLTLFLFSLVFYAWGEPVYILLMLFSTVSDYAHGLYIEKHRHTPRAKAAVISAIIINLALLGFFKYSDFLIQNINLLFHTDIPLLGLPLPIGISFYTFQTMSYSIDVYRGEVKAQRNIIDFGAYVTLFPQLIAGPIVRYATIADQLTHRQTTFDGFAYGVKRFVCGLGKKVLIANNVGLLWSTLSAEGIPASALGAWLGILAFGLQIYYDFSGYSDMAVGLGAMLGFRFPENFNYPYLSQSITEFWRRWHISLSTWFREYVYIPLGGNRRGLPRQLLNIAVVWVLTGVWHGASWNFVLWGAYFCVLLMAEKLFLKRLLDRAPAAVGHIYALLLVLFSWVIFAFEDLGQVWAYFGAMLGSAPLWDSASLYYLASFGPMLLVALLGCGPWAARLWQRVTAKIKTAPSAVVQCVAVAAVLLLSTAYLVDSTYNPFLYFRF